jgi:hypothetical protein
MTNGTVSVANQFALPTYNTKLLRSKDVPQKWEDLLDPKWKASSGINSTHHLRAACRSGAWGDEKTLDFVRKLAAQKPLLTRAGEMAQRLILGEVLVSARCRTSQLHERKSPVRRWPLCREGFSGVSPEYHVGVIKNCAASKRRSSDGGVHGFRGGSSPHGLNIPVTLPHMCREPRHTNSSRVSR